MSQIIEDMRKQERAEEREATALRMLKAGKYALEEIATISSLSLSEVVKLKKEALS